MKDINVVGQKMTREGCKMSNSYICLFFYASDYITTRTTTLNKPSGLELETWNSGYRSLNSKSSKLQGETRPYSKIAKIRGCQTLLSKKFRNCQAPLAPVLTQALFGNIHWTDKCSICNHLTHVMNLRYIFLVNIEGKNRKGKI